MPPLRSPRAERTEDRRHLTHLDSAKDSPQRPDLHPDPVDLEDLGSLHLIDRERSALEAASLLLVAMLVVVAETTQALASYTLALAMTAAWTALFFVWWALGLPLGPGAPVR